MPNKKDTGGIYQSLPTSEKTMDNHALSYKSPFTYADIKKSDGYSSFVDIEDSREEYEQAKQSCLLRSVAPDCRLLKLENILFSQISHSLSHCPELLLLRHHFPHQHLLLCEDPQTGGETRRLQTGQDDW